MQYSSADVFFVEENGRTLINADEQDLTQMIRKRNLTRIERIKNRILFLLYLVYLVSYKTSSLSNFKSKSA